MKRGSNNHDKYNRDYIIKLHTSFIIDRTALLKFNIKIIFISGLPG